MGLSQPVYERVVVDSPPDVNLGPIRARGPGQVAEMRRLRRGGASIDAIAAAYGISPRTVYRYLAEDVVETVVEVDGWRATFAIGAGRAPWRVSRWRRA